MADVILLATYEFVLAFCYCMHRFFSPSGAAAFSNAFFGAGFGQILLDNLGCVGTETRLVDCPHNGIGLENCVHAEDAGLRCAGKVYPMKQYQHSSQLCLFSPQKLTNKSKQTQTSKKAPALLTICITIKVSQYFVSSWLPEWSYQTGGRLLISRGTCGALQ